MSVRFGWLLALLVTVGFWVGLAVLLTEAAK